MQLHEALVKTVEKFGREIVCEQRCINILADYLAYEQYPSCRIILKAIIEEGIPKQILSFETDREAIIVKLKKFSVHLAQKYGFQIKLINYTLKALTNATAKNGLKHFNLEKFEYNVATGTVDDQKGQAAQGGNSVLPPQTGPTSNGGNRRKDPTIPPPTIISFQRRGTPVIGKECKFIWKVKDATSLHITGIGDLPVTDSGFCKIPISSPYQEIVLTASNAGGHVARTLIVNPGGALAVPLPTINYFRTSQTGKHVGDKTVLEWDVDGAKTIYLEGSENPMVANKGSQVVFIEPNPRVYTLKAINPVGRDVSESIVVKTIPPTILSATASSGLNKVKIGSDVKISWTTEDAFSVKISGTGIVCPSTHQDANGSLVVTVTDENPCVFVTAYNIKSISREMIKICTEEMQEPVIKEFSYKKRKGYSVLVVGDPIKCVWDLENTTSVQVLAEGEVVFSGKPSDTFIYQTKKADCQLTLVAKNSRHKVRKTLDVHVELPPKIKAFTTSTQLCKLGDTIDVSWEVENAIQVLLNGESVNPKGSRKITVNTNSLQVNLKVIAGERTAEVTIPVTAMAHPEPVIKYFRYPDDADRRKGKTIELQWQVENATEVKLAYNTKKIVSVPITGSSSFTIRRDKCTLTLIATNGTYKTEEKLVVERKKTFWEKIFSNS